MSSAAIGMVAPSSWFSKGPGERIMQPGIGHCRPSLRKPGIVREPTTALIGPTGWEHRLR